MTPVEWVALGNGLWGSAGLGLALAAAWVLRHRRAELQSRASRQMCYGGLIAGLLVWAHRSLWNIAIFIEPHTGEDYARWAIEHRWLFLLLVVGIVCGQLFAVWPFLGALFQRPGWPLLVVAWFAGWSGLSIWLA